MKLSNIAFVTHSLVNGLSLSLTPPTNEIYEAVLRNKFESRDNMEKILLELSDLETSIEDSDSIQSELVMKLKADLVALQQSFDKSVGNLDTFQEEKENLQDSLSEIESSHGNKIRDLENHISKQAKGTEEMERSLQNKINEIELEFHAEIKKTRNRENEILSKIDSLTKSSDEFMKSTKSRLFELSALENKSNMVLEKINSSNVENEKKINFIEEFEQTTQQRIAGQEAEIRLLSKMITSLQNKLSLDEFKEDRLAEKFKLTSLETMKKIDSLREEIDFLKRQQLPDDGVVHGEIEQLENELTEMEFEVFMQHMRMDGISRNNQKHVNELKETDYKLEDKLESVEENIHKIGTTVLVAQRKMSGYKP